MRFRLFFVPLASLFSWSRFNNSDPKILRMARWCFNHRQSYPPPTFPSSVASKHGKGTLFMPVLLYFSLVLGPIVNPLFFSCFIKRSFIPLSRAVFCMSFFQRSLRTTSFCGTCDLLRKILFPTLLLLFRFVATHGLTYGRGTPSSTTLW